MGDDESKASTGDESPAPSVPEDAERTDGGPETADWDSIENAEENALEALASRDGWRREGAAARVHYRGETGRFSIEYYARTGLVIYWTVPPADVDESAVPVGRDTVPDPLRERIRADLSAAGIDPDREGRSI